MANLTEIRNYQKRTLFDFLKLRKHIGTHKELDNLITEHEAEMDAEDVAWVEKKIEKYEL